MYSLIISVGQEFQSTLADCVWLEVFMNMLGLSSSLPTWQVSIGYWQSWCWLLTRDFFYHHFTMGLSMRQLASPTESDPRVRRKVQCLSCSVLWSHTPSYPVGYLGQLSSVGEDWNVQECQEARDISGYLWGWLSHLSPRFLSYDWLCFTFIALI